MRWSASNITLRIGGEYIKEIVLVGDIHVKTIIDSLWNCLFILSDSVETVGTLQSHKIPIQINLWAIHACKSFSHHTVVYQNVRRVKARLEEGKTSR